MYRILTIVGLGLFLLPWTVTGQEGSVNQPIRVRLSVSGPDLSETSIRAKLVRELEAGKGVVLTEVDTQWTLQVAALELECLGRREKTVVASVLVLETFSNAPLRVFLSDKVDTPTVTAIGELTSGLFRRTRHWLETAPAGDLDKLAKEIASRFLSALEEARASRQT
jgi:hypothetical protein